MEKKTAAINLSNEQSIAALASENYPEGFITYTKDIAFYLRDFVSLCNRSGVYVRAGNNGKALQERNTRELTGKIYCNCGWSFKHTTEECEEIASLLSVLKDEITGETRKKKRETKRIALQNKLKAIKTKIRTFWKRRVIQRFSHTKDNE